MAGVGVDATARERRREGVNTLCDRLHMGGQPKLYFLYAQYGKGSESRWGHVWHVSTGHMGLAQNAIMHTARLLRTQCLPVKVTSRAPGGVDDGCSPVKMRPGSLGAGRMEQQG